MFGPGSAQCWPASTNVQAGSTRANFVQRVKAGFDPRFVVQQQGAQKLQTILASANPGRRLRPTTTTMLPELPPARRPRAAHPGQGVLRALVPLDDHAGLPQLLVGQLPRDDRGPRGAILADGDLAAWGVRVKGPLEKRPKGPAASVVRTSTNINAGFSRKFAKLVPEVGGSASRVASTSPPTCARPKDGGRGGDEWQWGGRPVGRPLRLVRRTVGRCVDRTVGQSGSRSVGR